MNKLAFNEFDYFNKLLICSIFEGPEDHLIKRLLYKIAPGAFGVPSQHYLVDYINSNTL